MLKKMLLLAALAASAVAQAATYELPDPAVKVNPNRAGVETLVTIGNVIYRGPSAFYYLSECARPDSPHYHCSVYQEDEVTLTAPDGSTLVATIIYQHSSTLITSGRNWWRPADVLLSGTITQ